MKTIRIYNEDCPPDPCDDGDWEIKQFNRRHKHYVDPDSFRDNDGVHLSAEMHTMLDSGEAYLLDYFEHGNCMWSISGSGPQCQWDNSRGAGFLVAKNVEDLPADKESRRKLAVSFLEWYTNWCNGSIYSAEVLDAYGEKIESFYAFSEPKDLFEELSVLVGPGEKVKFTGNAAWLSDYNKLVPSGEAHEPMDVTVTKAVSSIAEDIGDEIHDLAFRDLLTEALHFAKREGFDFEERLAAAREVFAEEMDDKSDKV